MFSPNDRIRIAGIGIGGMGMGDIRTSLTIPGIELAAVCDIYDGRLARAKELWGSSLFTTRDYREVLQRKDIDAVVIATPDHWHARITRDALASGKDVYCQKPMVHAIDEGKSVIDAEKSSGRILQIGSQYPSSQVFIKTRDLLKSGAIGELNLVEAWLDRNSAIGAWQYTIPPDASPQNIDWDRFLGKAPKRPFEPVRLFRWRNYKDYGTGVAGDLFVHLLSGLHFATDSIGPTRITATGGLRFWKDGRDAPDVMLALMDYPSFTFSLKVNFASGVASESFGFRFVGSEGVLSTGYSSVSVARRPRDERRRQEGLREENDVRYDFGQYNAQHDHHVNFYNAVRSRKPYLEDGTFGFRAAGPALLTNVSMWEQRDCKWDPEKMVRVA